MIAAIHALVEHIGTGIAAVVLLLALALNVIFLSATLVKWETHFVCPFTIPVNFTFAFFRAARVWGSRQAFAVNGVVLLTTSLPGLAFPICIAILQSFTL